MDTFYRDSAKIKHFAIALLLGASVAAFFLPIANLAKLITVVVADCTAAVLASAARRNLAQAPASASDTADKKSLAAEFTAQRKSLAALPAEIKSATLHLGLYTALALATAVATVLFALHAGRGTEFAFHAAGLAIFLADRLATHLAYLKSAHRLDGALSIVPARPGTEEIKNLQALIASNRAIPVITKAATEQKPALTPKLHSLATKVKESATKLTN